MPISAFVCYCHAHSRLSCEARMNHEMVATAAIHGFRYDELISNLPYGKVLPSAIYLHRDTEVCKTWPFGGFWNLSLNLMQLATTLMSAKFRTNYPGFHSSAIPSSLRTPPCTRRVCEHRSDYGQVVPNGVSRQYQSSDPASKRAFPFSRSSTVVAVCFLINRGGYGQISLKMHL